MQRLVLVLLLVTSLGCSFGITGQGIWGNLGASEISTCGSVAEGEPLPEECTVVKGAPVSVPGAQIFSGVLALAAGLASKFLGAPLVP